MRFASIASAALLLAPLAAAQFAVRARSVDADALSTQDTNDLHEHDASQLHARVPALGPAQIQAAQDHAKGQEIAYNNLNGDLHWYTKNGASHQQLASTHSKMAKVAAE